MNLNLVFLTVAALTGSWVNADAPSADLTNDLEDFKNLLPEEKTDEIFFAYLFMDKEFQATANYVQTNEFKASVGKINSDDDIVNLYSYLEDAGLDVYGLMNELHDTLNLPHPPRRTRRGAQPPKITGGMAGFYADVRALFPKDKIAVLHKKKLETSPAFARFVERVKAPRFRELLAAIEANGELQQEFRVVKSGGVDIKTVSGYAMELWGIENQPQSTSLYDRVQANFSKVLSYVRSIMLPSK